MSKRVTGLAAILSNLQSIKRTIPQSGLAALRQGAQNVQRTARQFAPLDKGPLESSIKVHEEIAPDRASITVYVDDDAQTDIPDKKVGDYAMQMHEGSYELGPRSRAKQAQLGVQVGRKYLERALKQHRPSIVAALRAAIKQAIK